MKRSEKSGTTTWRGGCAFWRARLSLTVHRHRVGDLPDRWVFQPSLVWDPLYSRSPVRE